MRCLLQRTPTPLSRSRESLRLGQARVTSEVDGIPDQARGERAMFAMWASRNATTRASRMCLKEACTRRRRALTMHRSARRDASVIASPVDGAHRRPQYGVARMVRASSPAQSRWYRRSTARRHRRACDARAASNDRREPRIVRESCVGRCTPSSSGADQWQLAASRPGSRVERLRRSGRRARGSRGVRQASGAAQARGSRR
jgi:hypothetical protein